MVGSLVCLKSTELNKNICISLVSDKVTKNSLFCILQCYFSIKHGVRQCTVLLSICRRIRIILHTNGNRLFPIGISLTGSQKYESYVTSFTPQRVGACFAIAQHSCDSEIPLLWLWTVSFYHCDNCLFICEQCIYILIRKYFPSSQ